MKGGSARGVGVGVGVAGTSRKMPRSSMSCSSIWSRPDETSHVSRLMTFHRPRSPRQCRCTVPAARRSLLPVLNESVLDPELARVERPKLLGTRPRPVPDRDGLGADAEPRPGFEPPAAPASLPSRTFCETCSQEARAPEPDELPAALGACARDVTLLHIGGGGGSESSPESCAASISSTASVGGRLALVRASARPSARRRTRDRCAVASASQTNDLALDARDTRSRKTRLLGSALATRG